MLLQFIKISGITGLLACLTGACSPVKFLNLAASTDGYRVERDIAYGGNPRQKLDLYLPETVNGDTPVIVFFYGGSWQGGSKNDYLFAAQGLVSLGYVVAVPDYRVYPEVKYPAFLEDSAAAVVWVHNHVRDYGGNEENLFLMGHSAGAYNAAMIALNPAYLEKSNGRAGWVRGVVGIAGPYDFKLVDPDVIAVFSSEPKDSRKIQVITYADKHAPPMLIVTGAIDTVVGPFNSEHLYRKLQSLNRDVTYKVYKSASHYTIIAGLATSISLNAGVREDIRAFIAKH